MADTTATTSEPPTLSAETRSIVTATRPALESHGLAITTRLYERLFAEHPETKVFFADAPDGQEKRLAEAILAYCDHIDDLSPLTPVVAAIAEKHVAAGVQPEHYEIVGSTLLASMVDVLGELGHPVIDAWTEAYGYLANIFIEVEEGLTTAGSTE